MARERFKISDESGDRKYFSIIPHYISNHSTALEQSLYLQMKRIAGEGGTCWASLADLGKRMGVAKNTVRKYREKLVKREWIKKIGERPTGKTNQLTDEYEIVDLWELNIQSYSGGKSATIARFQERRVQPLHEKSATIASKEETVKKKYNKKEESADAPASQVKQFIDFFFKATETIRGIKPEITGGKEGKLVKDKLKKYPMEQLEKLTLWFLSDRKFARNYQTGDPSSAYRYAPAISFMLSTSVFNELLSAEKNEAEFLKRINEYAHLLYAPNKEFIEMKKNLMVKTNSKI